MPAPTGALGHFQALPFPARLAVGFLGMMGVIWLTRWLGGLSVPLAVLLWCAVGIGIWRADGGLTWADRYPWATRALERFAPRFVMTLAPASPVAASIATPGEPSSTAAASVGPAPAETPVATPSSNRVTAPDVSRFVGLDDVFAEINQLVTARVDRIVPIGPVDTPGLGGAYGPSDAAMAGLSDRIQTAIDGALLIDDLDWLAGGQAAAEVGSRLLAVARRYPRRLFVIGTGSRATIGRLDPGNRWLGQFNVRRIDFPPLSAAALRDIFLRLLEEKSLSLAAGADRAVDIQIEERRAQAGEEFDNAHAIRRLVDDVLHSHGLRVHGDSTLPAEERRIVTADGVRNATPTL